MTRILLVDDHPLMREGLRSILEQDRRLVVVGEASGGREAIRLVDSLRPDVVIMDVAMKDMNGIEATREIRARHPEIPVVALSSHSDRRYVSAILRAGAIGYVLKANTYDDLRRAVDAACVGRTYLSPEVVGGVVEALRTSAEDHRSAYEILGAREREVLQLVAEGRSSPEIAERLSVSVSTVETHRRNLMRKLNLHSVAELTKYAVREGLTTLDA